MKRFRFSLETLMRVRAQQEETQKRSFAEALYREREKESYIKGMEEETKNVRASFSGEIVGSVDVGRLISYQKYFSGQAMKKASAQAELNILNTETEKRRETFVEARKKRRVVEILKEKNFKRYLTELSREEQKELDDIVSVREARKLSSGGKE